MLYFIILASFGTGIFLGGLVLYCDTKVHERVSMAIMLFGCLIMFIGILLKDLT